MKVVQHLRLAVGLVEIRVRVLVDIAAGPPTFVDRIGRPPRGLSAYRSFQTPRSVLLERRPNVKAVEPVWRFAHHPFDLY